jgi:outer membrane lipoprotein-sorting protein
VVALLAAPPAHAGLSAAFDQTVSVDGDDSRSKVMIKDASFRVELEAPGARSIIIRNPKGIFSYLPEEGKAMRLPALAPAQRPLDVEGYASRLRRMQAVKIGEEIVQGHPCDIYEFADQEAGGAATKAWVRQQRGFPVRIEVEQPDGLMVVELSNIQLDAELDDALFELPAGVDVMELGG